MTTAIAPRFNVGDTFYIPSYDSERRSQACPDCLGERSFKVTAPSGDEFTMDCPRCGDSGYRLIDVPSLVFSYHVPKVIPDVIVGYCVNEWNEVGIRYKGKRGGSVKEDELITDEATALEKATRLAEEMNAKVEAEPKRIQHKKLANLPIRELVIDQFKSGLYDSWSAFRHLREVCDAIITNEAHLYGSRDDIVSSLEDVLNNTHRYDFVFKGFTRAMEAVVALVNASGATEAEILAALRKHWSAMPEAAQKVWHPTPGVAKNWDGTSCPTF